MACPVGRATPYFERSVMTLTRTAVLAVLLLAFVGAPLRSQSRRDEPQRPVTPPLELPKRSLDASLRLGPVEATIGTEDEEGPYLFAEIGSTVRGRDGTLYIGEYSTFQVRAFDPRGNHLASVGRRGRGPGEFVQAFALHHDGDSTLFAAQGYLGVSEFTAKGGTMRYRRTFFAAQQTGAICTIGSRLFLTVGGDSGVVRELDAERHEIRAFGMPFRIRTMPEGAPVHPAAAKMSNSWAPSMRCDDAAHAIFLWRNELGIIRRYDVDGTLKWETTLPSFEGSHFVPQGNGAAVLFPRHRIMSVVQLGADRLLLQVVALNYQRGRALRRAMSVSPGVDGYTWYVMDATTGKLLSKADGSIRYAQISETLLAEIVDDPYPMVRFRSLRPGAR